MSQLYWYNDKEKWQLYLDSLDTLVYLRSKESAKVTCQRRMDSELDAVRRLVDYIKNPPEIMKDLRVNPYKRRETLFKAISRCFDVIDRMNELKKEFRKWVI